MQNKMLPNLRQIHSVPPFETYVKSHIFKTCGQLSMTIRLFETYVKSHIFKTCGQLSMTIRLFETYVKSNASKP